MLIKVYDAEVRLVYGLSKGQTVQVAPMRAFGDVVANLTKAAVTWKTGSEGNQMVLGFQHRENMVDDNIVVLLTATHAVGPERAVEFEEMMTELVKASVPFFTWKISFIRVEIALTDRISYSSGAVPTK